MRDQELQQLLNETAARLGIVGAQLAIYRGGEQREFATGYRHRELELAVTPQTLFQIGSTTKVFSAALIFSLVDAGKVDVDASVQDLLPDFRLADVEAQQSITLRHLMSMTSGIDNGSYHDYGRGDDALGRYVDALAGLPHVFAPGTAFGYSNASTNVAGHVAARVMRKPWERLLTEHIVRPLGLKCFALLAEDLLEHPVALGYEQFEAEGVTRRIPLGLLRSMGPSGALACCSAGDLLRLARLFLDRGRALDGAQVLSAGAIDTMQQTQITLPTRYLADEWCLGPYRKQWGGHVLFGHSGTTRSGSSMLLWCPEQKFAVATVVNVAAQGYPFAEAIFDEIFPRLFGIRKPAIASPANLAAVQTELHPYVGRFEAFSMQLNTKIVADQLVLSGTLWSKPVSHCALISLGAGRFLPCDVSVSGNRNWDIAFWGCDAAGRATHLLQGVFPLRRTG